ncbi:MAG TPA: adenosine deaminase [Legionella sp.]|nr:adenosine deaminase [Legionella sp.]
MTPYRLAHWLFIPFFCWSSLATANVSVYFENIKSNRRALHTFFKNMPKGGELHYHLAGGAYPEMMLALAAHGDYCMDPKTFSLSTILTSCPGIHSKQLASDKYLYDKTLRAWSMKDFVPGPESGHDHFFASFFKFLPVASDYQAKLLADTMQRAAKQNELYLEIIVSPDNAKAASYGPLAQKKPDFVRKQRALLANKDFQNNVKHTIAESNRMLHDARSELSCDTKPEQAVCQLTVKFQYLVLREQPLDQVFAQALNGFLAATQSDNIVGINLVQAEDGVISLRDYQAQMAIFNFLHATYPTVHIALHAGELSLPSGSQSTHIQEAIKTGHAERIGHGVAITHENNATALLQDMARIPIPVEINLTSNRKILLISGQQHPLHDYLAHHVPVVLSTDDEGILRTDLTHQYVDAVMHHHLDYPTIKAINRNALTYSFLPGKSLWANATRQCRVPECQHLSSSSCLHFIQSNLKARLQWKLEMKLIEFERSKHPATHHNG